MNVDIIIPVYNQRSQLLLTLAGFQKQHGNNKMHIVVVDDGSKEDSSDIVSIYNDLDITYIYQSNGGRSKARNAAMKYCNSEYVIFNDADRIPDNRFVETHSLRLEGNNYICIGCLKEIYFSNIESHKLDIWNIICDCSSRLARVPAHYRNIEFIFDESGVCLSGLPWISTYSGNMSMSRKAFDAVGGFDENFITWGLEHFEFGYRLYKANFGFVLERNAVNYHLAHKREPDFYRDCLVNSHKYFLSKHQTKEVALLKRYMLGEISLQEFELLATGSIKWDYRAPRELFIRLLN